MMMGVQKLLFHRTKFIFLFRKMFSFFNVLWVSLFTLFGFSRKCVFRFQEKFITQRKFSNFELTQSQHGNHDNGCIDQISHVNDEGRDEEDESVPVLRFRFPTYEEFLRKNINAQSQIHPMISENPDDKISHVTDEDYVGYNVNKMDQVSNELSRVEDEFNVVENVLDDGNFTTKENIRNFSLDGSATQEDALSVSSVDVWEEFVEFKDENEKDMSEQLNDSVKHEDGNISGNDRPCNEESLVLSPINNEDAIRNETDSRGDYESDTLTPSSESSFRSSFNGSLSDELLSDIDFERAFEIDYSSEFGWNEENLTKDDIELQNLWKGYEPDGCDDENADTLQELKNLEAKLEEGGATLEEEHGSKVENEAENKEKDEKSSSGEQLSSDSDEQNGLETQWEHQDLLEQLKMEIKKVRAIGLPTILEESETPKIMDDLKPWKIEEKYQRIGSMDELHKFYKTYKERMRKLDILNYQKMYAIGFLRLKDPLQSITKNKISSSSLSTIVSLDCWPCKPKSITEFHQPVMKKFTKELESDLEMVYVGQMCLSWEFLRWQYGKALELWESDPHGMHQYNDVADKFQTFQVLLTRFLEDEPFQGPRVQHYVKNRCVHRNLLQVPLIRADNARNKRKERKVVSSKEAITSLQLVEIIEESIRILWRFIKTDKDPNEIALLKCRRRGYNNNVELQNVADADLLQEVRYDLQKKEKKLKELSRSEKCILRKIQRHHHQQDEGSDNVLYFFSQVDLRLVSRVLNMPRVTTDQLVWCSDKLNNIHLAGRRLHIDSSILLFPCS